MSSKINHKSEQDRALEILKKKEVVTKVVVGKLAYYGKINAFQM